MFDQILISRCFLGDNVRYNSEVVTLAQPLIELWWQQKRFISICPEVSGGLAVPREPAEIQHNSNEIITKSGINVSVQFNLGAQQALTLCQQHNIRFALLKESSPSCGSTIIYDGSFTNNKVVGQGVTSRLLTQHNISVFSENQLAALAKLLDKA
ncbi:MAG: DUF523 domain-containing protein [Colwellia sp.]|nr:DUF523 domain-containing protein [Colwellia sp.]